MYVTYIPNKVFSATRKEILPFVTTWMDLEDILLGEISQTEEDKYSMTSLTHIESKKQTKQKQRNNWWSQKGEGLGGERGANLRCKISVS